MQTVEVHPGVENLTLYFPIQYSHQKELPQTVQNLVEHNAIDLVKVLTFLRQAHESNDIQRVADILSQQLGQDANVLQGNNNLLLLAARKHATFPDAIEYKKITRESAEHIEVFDIFWQQAENLLTQQIPNNPSLANDILYATTVLDRCLGPKQNGKRPEDYMQTTFSAIFT